jgi:hypothetical protein
VDGYHPVIGSQHGELPLGLSAIRRTNAEGGTDDDRRAIRKIVHIFPPALVSFAPEESLAVVLPRGQIGGRNTTMYYF